MKSQILIVLGMIIYGCIAHATAINSGTAFNCSYTIYSAPFSDVSFFVFPDGRLDSSAVISISGKSHKETLTQEPAQSGELIHAWLSKESADNSIELIVMADAQASKPSKLINHHVPFGQEVGGVCQISSPGQ